MAREQKKGQAARRRKQPGERGVPGGGRGRVDVVGEHHVHPASGPMPPHEAEIRTMAEWGQGPRGAAGYEDHGDSGLSGEVLRAPLRPTAAESPAARPRPSGDELRRRFAWLSRFTDEEIRAISLCEEGDTLDPEDQYVDISHPDMGIIMPKDYPRVPEGACFVARSRIRASLWEKLTSGHSR